MMKTVARGGTPNIPGMGPIPGGARPGASAKRGKQPKVKGSRSGNPAKRAAENAGIAAAAPAAPTGSGFGLGAKPGGRAVRGRPRRAAEASRQGLSRAHPLGTVGSRETRIRQVRMDSRCRTSIREISSPQHRDLPSSTGGPCRQYLPSGAR